MVAGWTTRPQESVPQTRWLAKAVAAARYSTGSSEPTLVSERSEQKGSVEKAGSAEAASSPGTSVQGSTPSPAGPARRTPSRPSVSAR
jgi:uncharacterized membrane protein